MPHQSINTKYFAGTSDNCTTLAVFGANGINSGPDLTAAGWTWSSGNTFNSGSYATSPDFLQFFLSGLAVGHIQKALPGDGGIVKVRYGRDAGNRGAGGQTVLKIGGVVVETLSADTLDHLYVGPYSEGDAVRIEDVNGTVALVRDIQVCGRFTL